jgi:3-hydroxybutyryl-CoA dehydrogenase
MSTIGNAAIIGGGTMGAHIAAIYARAGWSVHVVEPNRESWKQSDERLHQAVGQLGGKAEPARIAYHAALAEVPWVDIAIVIECAPEKLALKQAIFAELVRLAPAATMLASNSSSFPISDIGRGLATRGRMLGLHFFMPAHLVPAVEVIRGEATDAQVCVRAAALMRELGKVPVNVKKDIPGFLANRIQHAMMREAFALIDAGLAEPEDVDAAVRYGFGLRFLASGPMLQRDLAGLDIHCAAAATMYPNLANNTAPGPTLAGRVAQGKLGMKTGEGLYRWDAASIASEKARYDRALLAAIEILNAERKSSMGN